MRKQIYFEQTEDHGPYGRTQFHSLMDRLDGVDLVGNDIANGGKDFVSTYHIEPEGVTLRYESSEEGSVLIEMVGKDEGIRSAHSRLHYAKIRATELTPNSLSVGLVQEETK